MRTRPLTAHELVVQAQTLCRHRGIPFPTDLRQYAHQWEREQFDLELCWHRVKPLVSSGRPLWQAEVDIRDHHARLHRERAARDRAAGDPLATSPSPSREDGWDYQDASDDVPSTSACGFPAEPDGPHLHPRQTRRVPRQPYRRRTGTLAHKVRELLKAHVVRRGPIGARKLERIAKSEGLLREDQEISKSSTFRRVMKELGIESHRIGFGRGAYYVLRVKPPAWSRALELGVHG